MVQINEDENDKRGSASVTSKPIRDRSSWLGYAFSGAALFAAVAIGVSFLLPTIRIRKDRSGESNQGPRDITDPPARAPKVSTKVDPPANQARPEKDQGPATGDRPQSPAGGPQQRQATAPGPEGPIGGSPAIPPPRVDRKPLPSLLKSEHRDWIHDASVAEFNRWVERLRPRGYEPFFVNGHNVGSRIPLPGDPVLSGVVRIAAIAVKRGPNRHFLSSLDLWQDSGSRFLEMRKNGYHLSCQTNFNDGPSAFVLAVYTEGFEGPGYGVTESKHFPDPLPAKWKREGTQPLLVAGCRNGDFWLLTTGLRPGKNFAWDFLYEKTLIELRQALDEAKGKAFWPESLFVCPGRLRGGFGVVLIHDKPDLLWKVSLSLTSAELESEAERMSAIGYRPGQVVGYETGAASRYLACWTRDPRRYPTTGLTDVSLEAVDEALEQFLIDQRIPSGTLAVFRNGRPHPVLSRGYGYTDLSYKEPCSPGQRLPIGDLSVPLLAGAVYSQISKKKPGEGALLTDILHPPAAGKGEGGRPPAAGQAQPVMTVGMLLDGLDDPHKEFTNAERKALAAIAGNGSPPATAPSSVTDLELRGLLLEKLLAAVTGKPPAEVAASELFKPARKSPGAPQRSIQATRQLASSSRLQPPMSGPSLSVTSSMADRSSPAPSRSARPSSANATRLSAWSSVAVICSSS